MIVHVKQDDGTIYQAVAIAIVYGEHFDTEFFIMKNGCEFERVFAYKQNTKNIIPQVMVVDIHTYGSDWIKTDKMEGLSLFVKHPDFLERIRNGEKELFKYGTDEFNLYNSLDVSDEINYGPILVETQDDVDNLLEFTGWFHDAAISEVKWNEKKTELTLAFNGIWGIRRLCLHFKGDVDLRLNEEYECDYLFGASIFFEKEKVCFIGAEDFHSMKEIENDKYITGISARKMSYSFEYGKPIYTNRGGPEQL